MQYDDENHSGAIALSAGALVAWLRVGALHYSDSADRRSARGVSALDSIALLFVVIHFSGLLWIYGHHRTPANAERKYEAQAEKFNQDARQFQDANMKNTSAKRRAWVMRLSRSTGMRIFRRRKPSPA